jgi:hypothetical protein
MNFWMLFTELLPIAEQIAKAIAAAEAAGKDPALIHQTVIDHAAQLPAKIRE